MRVELGRNPFTSLHSLPVEILFGFKRLPIHLTSPLRATSVRTNPPSVTAKPSPAPAPLPSSQRSQFWFPQATRKQVAQPSPCPSADRAPNFHREVRPILEAAIQCHGMEKQKGELRLDTLQFAKKGGIPDPLSSPKIWPRASFSNGLIFLPTMMRSAAWPAPLRRAEGRSDPLDPKLQIGLTAINFIPNRNAPWL